MYAAYNKHDILLWCYFVSDDILKQRTRPATNTVSTRMPPQKRTCESTIVAVQELKKKHESQYSSERLNAWAHMVNMGNTTA